MELAKLARRDGQHFDCAIWLHKAREMPHFITFQVDDQAPTGSEHP